LSETIVGVFYVINGIIKEVMAVVSFIRAILILKFRVLKVLQAFSNKLRKAIFLFHYDHNDFKI